MAASKPPQSNRAKAAAAVGPVPASAAETPARPKLPPKIRAGMGDVTTEFVETYSDDDYRRATGLFTVLPPGTATDPRGESLSESGLGELDASLWQGIHRSMLRLQLLEAELAKTADGGGSRAAAAEGGPVGASTADIEAAVAAPLAAVLASDWIVPGQWDAAAALHRGLPMKELVASVFGNSHDRAKGHRWPAHPVTPRTANVLPASTTSPSSATHLPQAAGLAWAAKIKRDPTVVLAYLDEGATSAEDFHTGLNFAAVFHVPVVFVCINRAGASGRLGQGPERPGTTGPGAKGPGPIDASGAETRGPGAETLAVKALAYGIPGVRVDGGDALAVFSATRAAVERARAGKGPTFIEAFVRLPAAIDPLSRLATWMGERGMAVQTTTATVEITTSLREAMTLEAVVPPPALGSLIEDVYVARPAALIEQLADATRARPGAPSEGGRDDHPPSPESIA